MLKIYDLLVSLGWSIYKFADKRRYNILRKQLLNDAPNHVLWQDFFEHNPNSNPFNTAHLNDVFIEDDEEL